MNRYESYKDVDLPWLKEVPSHWEVSKIKRISYYDTGNSIKDSEKDNYTIKNQTRKYISTSDINKEFSKINHKSGLFIPKTQKAFKIAKKNSTLVCIEGGSGGEKVALIEEDVCYVNKLCSFYTEKMNSKYFFYYFKSNLFKSLYFSHVNGDRNGVSKQNLGLFVITIPGIQEQTQIANYLDWKINEIDKLIAKEKEKIRELEKLTDYKISEMIWNNKNFKLERIKNLFTLRNERHVEDKEVDLISLYTKLGVIRNEEVEYKTGNKNTTIEGYKKVYVNDIVVNIMLCWMGAIGVSKYDGVTSPAYDIYKPNLKKVNPHFFHYLFRTQKFKDILYKNGKGIVLMKWRVYSDKFRNISVPLFSLIE
ncbi:restriction endonuclease subunit S [Streptococcus suis]|uniref:restriction endonuclease subunit S n=1 Tax=Streptococcus suis TaxID=1307 RepID=UPI0005CEA7CA|nr:restriction endonuclease subunit S [Streptococcus suis]NQH49663.1 restriction endonuclease subunit S [Streptococcus suis]NQN39609.1 restriction endonuclease subunit S [Streptococcus suis]NQN41599.1 restriction endonuclease subunit S [Streptococcus suis]NQO25161.1 restriction endonuclease subunit S [Streptococcus suis]NQO31138.1 restriction endonuclease subunit S [Streptococcus suis]